jgi:hypothetical protein
MHIDSSRDWNFYIAVSWPPWKSGEWLRTSNAAEGFYPRQWKSGPWFYDRSNLHLQFDSQWHTLAGRGAASCIRKGDGDDWPLETWGKAASIIPNTAGGNVSGGWADISQSERGRLKEDKRLMARTSLRDTSK